MIIHNNPRYKHAFDKLQILAGGQFRVRRSFRPPQGLLSAHLRPQCQRVERAQRGGQPQPLPQEQIDLRIS